MADSARQKIGLHVIRLPLIHAPARVCFGIREARRDARNCDRLDRFAAGEQDLGFQQTEPPGGFCAQSGFGFVASAAFSSPWLRS